jgi:hypothetical protein
MATNVRKKISELTALTSASLDTTLVGVDGGTTYKIELDTLADAVTSRVNILDRSRLSSLESATSSFESKGRSIISSSAQISAFGFISSSHTDITSLNSFTQSQEILNTAFTNGISARLQTSSFNDFSASVHSEIVAATNEQSFNGLISGSSQFTSSYDERYVLSGSITQTTWDNIANKPSGIVSQSTDLSSLNTFTASISTASLVTSISNLNTFTASQSTSSLVDRLGALEFSASRATSSITELYDNAFIWTQKFDLIDSVSGSWITESETGSFLTSLNGAISSSAQITAFGFVSGSYETTGRGIISSSANLVTTSSFNSYTASISTASLVTSISNINSFTQSFSSSVDNRLDTLESSIITGSVNYVQKLGSRVTGVTSTGVTIISETITTTGNPVQIMVTGDANPIGGVAWTRLQIYRDSTAIGNIVHVENSSNLNVPYCVNVIDTPSAGTYTYSMRTVSGHSGTFDFGEQSGPTLTAVELKTNTNLPSTNNTFTGTNTFRSTTIFASAGGDEGGEIQFGVPVTNTTLQNRVTADVWQNRLRFFEGSAGANGVYIDLSKPTGNNNEITYKASGLVNAGTFVQLDNIKATITTSGQRGLSLATISGTFVCNIAGNYAGAVVGASGSSGTATITTSASTSLFGWGFTTQGDIATYIITDTTNSRAYRITIQIGGSYLNNLVSIERLH